MLWGPSAVLASGAACEGTQVQSGFKNRWAEGLTLVFLGLLVAVLCPFSAGLCPRGRAGTKSDVLGAR